MYIPRRTAAHFLKSTAFSFRHAHTSTAKCFSPRPHVLHTNNRKWPSNQSISPTYLCSSRRPNIFPWRLQIDIHESKRFAHSPADQETVLDRPPTLVRAGRKHRPLGLAFLALIPIISFCLGTWQVQRLGWKTDLIARYEDRLLRQPLPLPPQIDTSSLGQFDYRRITATGKFRHSAEMLLGPRIYEGENGFMVITPFDRPNGASTILVNRGWIPKSKMRQEDRDPEALPRHELKVGGLLRHDVWKKNIFTPDNRPDINEFYFPDIDQMAGLVGAQPVWVEETMSPDYVEAQERIRKGMPVGRPAEVNLRNNHLQYIFTWYALSAATSFMFFLLVKKPPSEVARRVRHNREW